MLGSNDIGNGAGMGMLLCTLGCTASTCLPALHVRLLPSVLASLWCVMLHVKQLELVNVTGTNNVQVSGSHHSAQHCAALQRAYAAHSHSALAPGAVAVMPQTPRFVSFCS